MVSPVSSGCNLDISQCTAYFVSLKFDTEISPETKESDAGGESLPSAKLSSLEAPLPPKRLNHHNTLPLFFTETTRFYIYKMLFYLTRPDVVLYKDVSITQGLEDKFKGHLL